MTKIGFRQQQKASVRQTRVFNKSVVCNRNRTLGRRFLMKVLGMEKIGIFFSFYEPWVTRPSRRILSTRGPLLLACFRTFLIYHIPPYPSSIFAQRPRFATRNRMKEPAFGFFDGVTSLLGKMSLLTILHCRMFAFK